MDTNPPIACTLAAGELAGRLDEIRALAQQALIGRERKERSLSLVYRRTDEVEAAVRDLVRREQACCAFLDFAVRVEGERIVVDVGAPEGAEAVLDAF